MEQLLYNNLVRFLASIVTFYQMQVYNVICEKPFPFHHLLLAKGIVLPENAWFFRQHIFQPSCYYTRLYKTDSKFQIWAQPAWFLNLKLNNLK